MLSHVTQSNMTVSNKSFISKIEAFFRSSSKIKLDENSWLEAFSPEERLYCEQSRKLIVHLDFQDNKSLLVSLPRNWGMTSKDELLTEEQLELIASKLKKYFESDGFGCVVEYFDPWKT